MSEWTKGFWAMIAVCLTWGFSPLYYRTLSSVPVVEVLAHRTLWSLFLFVAIIAVQGRLAEFRRALTGPHFWQMAFAAVMISVNWGLFIWSVKAGHVVQSSLGYYIFPLVAVLLGVVLFGERLTVTQIIAVLLAALAVALLTWGLGVTPWISLALAITFGGYGVAKKSLPMGPVISVACEVAILAPLALAWLLAQKAGIMPPALAAPVSFGSNITISLLLMLSGLITALPLIMFSYATRRVEMGTIGLMQYLNPTLQFLCAVVIFGEPFTMWHKIAFSLIWIALALYSVSAIRQGRRSIRRVA